MKQLLIALFTAVAVAGTAVYAPLVEAKAKHSKADKQKAKAKAKAPKKK